LAERNREMRILITMAIASGKEILKRWCFLLGLLICKQPFSSFKAYSFIYIGGFILQGIKFEPFVYFDSFSSQLFSLYIYIYIYIYRTWKCQILYKSVSCNFYKLRDSKLNPKSIIK
jgi:hypothetical protein